METAGARRRGPAARVRGAFREQLGPSPPATAAKDETTTRKAITTGVVVQGTVEEDTDK
ncbi:hypothetical protein [Tessaracoccus aquimaris]|uniref:hypothetical protein n=1 Tax=Tessaracoccus aquimaris TaxID=1332264 RepID=UPI0013149B99|nr:hypothetical protein [Tessaracoccus aquimaris]